MQIDAGDFFMFIIFKMMQIKVTDVLLYHLSHALRPAKFSWCYLLLGWLEKR
jgi:hypothetical protein